jgi:ABC-2 type transport system ATP-binding protein
MIRVSGVSKSYGSTLAVDDASFEVAAGEVVGFLGPNGAGKSTLLKMISTWHGPDAGTIEVAGLDTVKQPLAVRQSLGYLPEHNALWDTMTVDRLLHFIGRMRGLRGEELEARRGWVIDRCELGEVLSKRVNQCSKGFRQRIGVAAALLHDPSVVLLDEPTHGLDPMQVVAFRDFIRELATMPITMGPAAGSAGRAVLFSSHILAEVAAISDRILVIRSGRLLLDERTDKLKERAAREGRSLEQLVVGHMESEVSL